MEEVGIVKSIEGRFATVLIPRKSACEGCSSGACRAEDQGMELEALNQANAAVGQRVRVSIKSYTYLRSSLLVYGLPALALVAGAVAGKEILSSFFPGRDPEIVSAVSGFAFLIISFLMVKIYIARSDRKTEFRPVIEEIINSEGN